ncbi:hypothetical protein WME98_44000 [Sorangium sp. So ce296]|uniref:hypothetical protein n=1 Tax=Sorangium sp. So ce296 TaxID=3133296 RepID=UPI003F5ED245
MGPSCTFSAASFSELDEHARVDFGARSFARLTGAQQQGLVDALLGGTIVPLTMIGPDAALALQARGRLMVIIVKIAYWTNFPEHRVRAGALGFGSGELVFSDPENLITNPNDIDTMTAFDYLGWHYPLRIGVERDYEVAFLQAGVDEDSDATLISLLQRDQDRTLIKDP